MKRLIIPILIAIALTAAASAQIPNSNYPMVPYANPAGPSVSGGLTGPMIPGNIGGEAPPPPTCSNSLDFSDGCNSQYLSVMRF